MTRHPLVLSLSKGAALLAAWLFVDRIVAGLMQCSAVGSCPW